MFLRYIHITFIYLVLGISQCTGWTTITSYNYVSTRHIEDDVYSRKLVLAESSTDESLGRSQAEMDLLQLAQGHFASQSLVTAIKCGVFDVLSTSSLTVDEIISKIVQGNASTINRDALFRCMRLLCTTGVINETINKDNDSAFLLTDMGRLLQSQSISESDDESSMAPFILHWSSHELWDSWLQLPSYVVGDDDSNLPPFDRAHNMSCSDYYKNNTEECEHRNDVARQTSRKEIDSILDALQVLESSLVGKTIVDIGGGYGDLMYALIASMPVGKCYCLDLPGVIEDAISTTTDSDNNDDTHVSLIPGDMFDTSSIPQCDYIFTKHVLCDFCDEDVVRALQSFHKALSKGGKCIIMDAVLPNCDDLNGKWNAAVSFDVLLMLSGRRGERSRLEWSNLAKKAGFVLDVVLLTSSVTVDLAILSKV